MPLAWHFLEFAVTLELRGRHLLTQKVLRWSIAAVEAALVRNEMPCSSAEVKGSSKTLNKKTVKRGPLDVPEQAIQQSAVVNLLN